MLKPRGNKGITLIALVITIIVLLILAGVTIAQITGQDSAPNKAAEAKIENERGAAKDEAVMLATKYVQEYYDKKYVQNLEVETTGSVPNEKIQVGANGDSTYSVSGVNLPKLLAEKIPATIGEYVARQFSTRASSEGQYNYSVGTGNKLTISTKAGEELTKGTIQDDGVIAWDDGSSSEGEDNPSTWTGSITAEEQTKLTANGMSLVGDADVPSKLKTGNVKAVLTGNVPIPTGYTYKEGTSTTLASTPTSWGVVIEDQNHNEYVWVPANASDMYEISNEELVIYPEIDSSSSSSSSSGSNLNSDEQEKIVTTNKYSKSYILSRGLPNEYNNCEPSMALTGYCGDLDSKYLAQANFTSPNQLAQELTENYSNMIDSIEKYGGFYVGRYELSGSVDAPEVKRLNTPLSANWYELYLAMKKLGTNSTQSMMVWGIQWDRICDFIEKEGDKKNHNSVTLDSSSWGNYFCSTIIDDDNQVIKQNNKNQLLKTGISNYTRANNIYDIAGNLWEYTQEVNGTSRILRGGGYYYYNSEYSGYATKCNAADPGNGPEYGCIWMGSRPTLYIK